MFHNFSANKYLRYEYCHISSWFAIVKHLTGKPTDTLSKAINDRIEAVPCTIDCARIVQETII